MIFVFTLYKCVINSGSQNIRQKRRNDDDDEWFSSFQSIEMSDVVVVVLAFKREWVRCGKRCMIMNVLT